MNVYFQSSSTPGHTNLVSRTVAEMSRQGMTNIRASHISGYAQPEPIGSFIPDAVAFFRGRVCVAECESADGLAQAHTANQWRAFHRYAVEQGGLFIAVVAATDVAAARQLLQRTVGTGPTVLLWTF